MAFLIRKLRSFVVLQIAGISWLCLLAGTKLSSLMQFWYGSSPGMYHQWVPIFCWSPGNDYDLWCLFKGGKAWKFSCPHDRSKPSTASDCGSGLHETCFSSCLFICDAKKLISGKILNFVISFIKKDTENYHSTLSLRCLDIKLTLMFLQPGMTSAEILTFCVVQKFPNMFW